MKRALTLGLCLLLVSTIFAADEPVKKNPKAKDFVGKWEGKWDNVFKVQFTISEEKGQLKVVYEWEETLGQPLRTRTIISRIDKDQLNLNFIEITLSATDPNKAKAVGKFAKPRTAELTRVKK